jgi:hydrogenase maturation protease
VILVAGVGNIFLGDDAFGSEVARRMLDRAEAAADATDVRIVDFGIRGLDLAYALADGYDAAIIVDTFARSNPPGTICVVEPDLNDIDSAAASIEAHAMDPVRVLAMARSMGAELRNVYIVGCEPETFGSDEGHMGLSVRVAAALDPAIQIIESLIAKLVTREAIV